LTLPPPARGARRDWSELPHHVVSGLGGALGGEIVAAETQPGGFSPGVAARVVLAGGRRVFVKAVAHEPNPESPEFHRREARIIGALPVDVPAPRLLWTFDEGKEGWVVLALEDVDGREPSLPWRPDELDRVLAAVEELHSALTPSPVDAGSAGAVLEEKVNAWHLLGVDTPAGLDEWSRRHLKELVELEGAVADAVAGDTLLHFDLRADNILLARDRVYFVDWPHASVGASWLDAVAFAPSVAMQGGPQPEALLSRWPAANESHPRAVTSAVASVAGFFTYRALLPPPPGLPTLRSFQAAQGEVARRWLAQRTGWK
jgi:Phosphotransferase enzyme family